MKRIEELINNGSFCVLPFIHQEKKFNGSYHICCYGDQLQSDVLNDSSLGCFNSEKMSTIRLAMLNGIKHDACKSCYQQEENNISSPRLRENVTWANWKETNAVIEKSINKFVNQQVMHPISYDLRYSNTCTLKCRMCNSSSSSALNAEYKKLKSEWPEKFWTIDNPRINHELELTDDIIKIYLAGGEPLVEPYNLELLEKLVVHNTNVSLLINTSLNIVTDRFLQVLNKFKNLTLVVSIDGTDRVNDYIRHGSNFNTVIENIKKLQHHNLMFSTCVSMYNIFNISNLVKFINQQFPNATHGIHLVNDIPEIFVDNIPIEYRTSLIIDLESCLDKLSDFTRTGIQNIITVLKQNNYDANNFQGFIKYTTILDNARNESVTQIIPQLRKYFHE